MTINDVEREKTNKSFEETRELMQGYRQSLQKGFHVGENIVYVRPVKSSEKFRVTSGGMSEMVMLDLPGVPSDGQHLVVRYDNEAIHVTYAYRNQMIIPSFTEDPNHTASYVFNNGDYRRRIKGIVARFELCQLIMHVDYVPTESPLLTDVNVIFK